MTSGHRYLPRLDVRGELLVRPAGVAQVDDLAGLGNLASASISVCRGAPPRRSPPRAQRQEGRRAPRSRPPPPPPRPPSSSASSSASSSDSSLAAAPGEELRDLSLRHGRPAPVRRLRRWLPRRRHGLPLPLPVLGLLPPLGLPLALAPLWHLGDLARQQNVLRQRSVWMICSLLCKKSRASRVHLATIFTDSIGIPL